MTAVDLPGPAASTSGVPGSLELRPLNEFVVKVAARCNLNCDYCYIYNLGDTTWRRQPKLMSREVVDLFAGRLAQHARAHRLPAVLVSLHGGEPLLWGAGAIEHFVTTVRRALPGATELHLSMQTNATLVTEELAVLLRRLGVGVGVSVDGDETGNDRHRLDLRGRSSYANTKVGIELLAEHGVLTGVLCVIDLENDPVRTYRSVTAYGAPSVDFLLPHGNHSALPSGKTTSVDPRSEPAPYGRWLSRVYDEWSRQSAPRPKVRLLSDTVHLLLGGAASFEAVGLSPTTLITVETDGTIELVDHLKSAWDGAAWTGLALSTHDFNDALLHPAVASRQEGERALPDYCRACPVMNVCGGGLVTHRWHPSTAFMSPSVYCSDMFQLIGHIEADLHARLRGRAVGAGALWDS